MAADVPTGLHTPVTNVTIGAPAADGKLVSPPEIGSDAQAVAPSGAVEGLKSQLAG
jgi:hypothetical protein